jgi:CubicO group peptidase (beta-lactamase class C family)
VRIKDILQMSSGARWNEDYSDPRSDVMQLGIIMAVGGDLKAFVATLEREREPGTYNQYNSMDTQVLGLLLVNATGRPIFDYMQEKLWHRLGMESDAFWIVDSKKMEVAFFGLNATARDYAKLGELYRLGGYWQGTEIVPQEWVEASLLPDAPHLLPGDNPLSDHGMGYGYQWWLMDGEDGEYSAIGVYNQFIYVNPTQDLVIVKLSANNTYGMTDEEESYREFETIEIFRAIGSQFD